MPSLLRAGGERERDVGAWYRCCNPLQPPTWSLGPHDAHGQSCPWRPTAVYWALGLYWENWNAPAWGWGRSLTLQEAGPGD